MNAKQRQVKADIIKLAEIIGVDPPLGCAIAEVESSFGINQKSPTGCLGVFQMSSIAMKDLFQEMSRADHGDVGYLLLRLLARRYGHTAIKDLLWEMAKVDDELADIICGLLFLRLLLKRHKTIEAAVAKYCDPKDRHFYVPKVMNIIKNWGIGE